MAVTQKQQSATPISSIRRRYLLLGEEYTVQINHGSRNSMRVDDHVFHVTLKEMTRECFDEYIENWYRRTARKVFQQCLDSIDSAGIKPQIKIYKMRRAWGRCYYQKGTITLNLHLIKTPLPCVEYILRHEYCHFTHHNHGQDFHEMVATLDPDWKDKDKLLKEFTRTKPTLLQKLHI